MLQKRTILSGPIDLERSRKVLYKLDLRIAKHAFGPRDAFLQHGRIYRFWRSFWTTVTQSLAIWMRFPEPAMDGYLTSIRLHLFARSIRLAFAHWVSHWVCAYLCLSICMATARAQMQDSFEGGIPRWQLVESDCNAQLTLQEISLSLPRSGQTCELMQVSAGNGTFVYVAYPIEPCVIIDEFQPRLWTQCASAGIRIGVRVVFPTSFHQLPVVD